MSRSDDSAYRSRGRGPAVNRDLDAAQWEDRQPEARREVARETRRPALRGSSDPQGYAEPNAYSDPDPYAAGPAQLETGGGRRDAGLRADVNARGNSRAGSERFDNRGAARNVAHDPRGVEPDLGGPGYADPAYAEPSYAEPVAGDPAWDARSQPRAAQPRAQRGNPALPDPYAKAYADPRASSGRDYQSGGQSGGTQAGYDEAGYEQAGYDQQAHDQTAYQDPAYADPNGYQTGASYDDAGYEKPAYGQGHQEPRHQEPRHMEPQRAEPAFERSRGGRRSAQQRYAEPEPVADPRADPQYETAGGYAEPGYVDEYDQPAGGQQPGAYADPYAEPAYDDAAQYDQNGNYIGGGQGYEDPNYAGQGGRAHAEQAYAEQGYTEQGYAEQGYDEAQPADYADQHERAARPRSRMGLVIGGALAAAIAVGGGLGLAYNLLSGGSSSGEPAKIAANRDPVKAAPAERGGKVFDNQGKQVYERLGGGTATQGGNRVVTGEQPAVQRPSAGITVLGAAPSQPGISIATSRQVYAPATGSASTGTETVTSLRSSQGSDDPNALKRVPTVMVRPGEKITASAPNLQLAPSAQPTLQPSLANSGNGLPGLTTSGSGLAPLPEPSPSPQRNVARLAPAPAATAAPVQVALQQPRVAAPATAPSGAGLGGGYVAQVVSSKSRLEALAAFADMQARYGSVLTGKEHDIQEVDLGTRGRWYRLRIGPPASKDSANQLCSSLKQAGLRDCLTRPY